MQTIISTFCITTNERQRYERCKNIIKFIEYGLNNGYELFVNTYSKHGRSNSPDWALHLVPFDVKWKVIKQIKEYLREDNRILFTKLSDNYIAQLNKIIKLLS